MTKTSDDYQWPQSLKANLELLAQLQQHEGIRKKVTEEALKGVEKYITKDVDRFADEHASSGYLFETISKSTELRKGILKSNSESKYDTYKSHRFNENKSADYSQRLIDNVFPLFGCLYYMYFECSSECHGIQGMQWYNERCDGSIGDHSLKNWLEDTTQSSTGNMIQRGFQEGDLGQKTGKEVFPYRYVSTGSESLLAYHYGAQLQFALYYMLFLPDHTKWNNAQSGHAVLFLQALCKMVSENKFNGQYKEAEDGEKFKSACEEVSENIKTFTELNIIAPVALYQTGKYKDLLEATHFWNYIKWLEQNLPKLIDSLEAMEKDVSKWKDRESLKKSTTFGPFPWGFTFAYRWESNTGQLNTQLSELISSLKKLESVVRNIKPIPPSNGSSIGSVIGGVGAAAATAGAAYAGSGFLGPVVEGVSKFVKGLFI